jgi:hypothetical protein
MTLDRIDGLNAMICQSTVGQMDVIERLITGPPANGKHLVDASAC